MGNASITLTPEEKAALEAQVKGKNTFDVLDAAKALQSKGDLVGAAKLLSVGGGIDPNQAYENMLAQGQGRNAINTSDLSGQWQGGLSGNDNIANAPTNVMATTATPDQKTASTAQVAATQQAMGQTTQPQPATAPQPVAPAQPQQPPSNPLPSSTGMGQQAINYAQPTSIDMGAIRSRAQNDANLQVQMLRDEALRNYGRYQTEGQSQIAKLQALYAPQYQQNKLNTVAAARNAVQGAANRGFFASGLSENADRQAQLAGEQQRMALAGQENAQIGEIQNRMNQSGQELNDMLQSLTGREAQLIQSLVDSYGKDERSFDLQNRGLSSDIALRLLGMDQNYTQFNQGLSWDQSKFAQQLADAQTQRGWQSGENALNRGSQADLQASQQAWQSGENRAQRDWSGYWNQQQMDNANNQAALDRQNRVDLANLDANSRMQLQQAQQAWQAGQADLDRADAQTRFNIETGLQAKWHDEQSKFDQAQFQWRKDESQADRTLRTQAANSQWMAFADQALQAGQWKTYNDAVKALDANSARVIADGADMTALLNFVKRRMGVASSTGQPSMNWYVNPNQGSASWPYVNPNR